MDAAAEPFVPKLWFPPAERERVCQSYRDARVIGEYGAGGSTVFAAEHSQATIRSIESDREWADKTRTYLAQNGLADDRIDIRWCDIGPTGPWGRPAEWANWNTFWTYPMALWEGDGFRPDLVLIDGRFRLACFAATLMMARAPLTVLFDDYAGRPSYHRAEQLCPKSELVGHMAVFHVTPRTFGNDDFARVLPWFFDSL